MELGASAHRSGRGRLINRGVDRMIIDQVFAKKRNLPGKSTLCPMDIRPFHWNHVARLVTGGAASPCNF
jgi:hypothetical protein